MKKLAGIFLFVLITQVASSQVLIALLFGDKLNSDKIEFGLLTGPGFTNITNTNGDYRTGLNLGLYFNFKISKNFYLHPEAIPKCALGTEGIPVYATPDPNINSLFANGSVTRKIKAISVPLLARYRIYKTLFAEAGPQLDWQVKVIDEFVAKASDGNEVTYTSKVTSDFNWLTMGLAGGLSWKFKDTRRSMSLGARYYYGLTDIQKTATATQAHRGAFLFVYIPIGVGKKSTTVIETDKP